jgi:hypothetical protein
MFCLLVVVAVALSGETPRIMAMAAAGAQVGTFISKTFTFRRGAIR